MRTVWKFPLVPGANFIPQVVRVVHIGIDPVGDQDGPTAWVERHDAASMGVWLQAFGTGMVLPHEATEHVGSCVTPTGLVWHVYKMWGAP